MPSGVGCVPLAWPVFLPAASLQLKTGLVFWPEKALVRKLIHTSIVTYHLAISSEFTGQASGTPISNFQTRFEKCLHRSCSGVGPNQWSAIIRDRMLRPC